MPGRFTPVLLRCADKVLDLSRPAVMGVLNVTPDSFSDGGQFATVDEAVRHGLRMADQGAAIIDVGGESTRPGAAPVSIDEELGRVVPVIERLSQATDAIISIDTSKPVVMRAAAAAGAGLINDVRALLEPDALDAAVSTHCAVCVMHMQGEPRNMQQAPIYADVVREVRAFLQSRVQSCLAAGLGAEQLAIDPGFGFGKTQEHNVTLLRNLRELDFGVPIIVGLSRKSMVGSITGRPPGERLHGSVALAVLALLNGARIVRAHDVAASVDAVKAVLAVQG